MREDNGAAVGKKGICERDGGVEVLPDEEIAVIKCCSDYFEEDFMRFGDRSRNVIQSEGMIIPGGRNGDGFWHGEEALDRSVYISDKSRNRP